MKCWSNIRDFYGGRFMRKFIVLLIVALGTAAAYGQVTKGAAKPKPAPVAVIAPAPKPKPIPTQKVVVEKMNGDRLTGLFVEASSEKITVSISDAKIDIPFSGIASIRVNEAPAPV